MTDNIKIEDKQLIKLNKDLDKMGKDLKTIPRKLNKQLPQKIVQTLKEITPKDSGDTARSWKSEKVTGGFRITNKKGGIIEFLIKGVKPHKIGDGSSVLKIQLGSSVIFAKVVQHPGYGPKIDENKMHTRLQKLMDEEMEKIMDELLKKNLKG